MSYSGVSKIGLRSGIVPMEFWVVIELDPTEEKTAGGIILPTSKKDRDEMEAEEGILDAVSEHAWSYADKWSGDHPDIGERVMFERFQGYLREINGRRFRIVKDKHVIGVISRMPATPAAIRKVA